MNVPQILNKNTDISSNHQIEFNEIVEWISHEMDNACGKFPGWPEDIIHAINLISEEVGELQKTGNEAVYEPDKFGYDSKTDQLGSPLSFLRREAIQTASMAIRFLMHLHQYKYIKSSKINTKMRRGYRSLKHENSLNNIESAAIELCKELSSWNLKYVGLPDGLGELVTKAQAIVTTYLSNRAEVHKNSLGTMKQDDNKSMP